MRIVYRIVIFLVLVGLNSCKFSNSTVDENKKPLFSSDLLNIERITDHCFVHTSYLKAYGNFPCNGMIYVQNKEAVIFDTPTDSAASKELLDWLELEEKIEIKAVVVNHFHMDCLGGLKVFHQRGIPSYANHKTIALSKSSKSQGAESPQNGFEDEFILEMNNREIVNSYFGKGHTSDNIVSFIPSERVLFGGCMIKALKAKKGNLADADENEWPNTVSLIKNKYSGNVDYVIPGHGKPGGIELLDYTIDLFSNTKN